MAKSNSKPKSRAPKMKTLTMCASNMCIMVLLLFILFFVLYTQTNIFKNKTIEGMEDNCPTIISNIKKYFEDFSNNCIDDNSTTTNNSDTKDSTKTKSE